MRASKFTAEDVTRGLLALASSGGNVQATAKQEGIDPRTLKSWRDVEHVARYRELEAVYVKEVEGTLVQAARMNAQRAGEIERDLIERMAESSDRDAPQALRAITDAKSKNLDKLLALTGRPSTITEHRSGEDILRSLAALKVLAIKQPDVISTAVEIEP